MHVGNHVRSSMNVRMGMFRYGKPGIAAKTVISTISGRLRLVSVGM